MAAAADDDDDEFASNDDVGGGGATGRKGPEQAQLAEASTRLVCGAIVRVSRLWSGSRDLIREAAAAARRRRRPRGWRARRGGGGSAAGDAAVAAAEPQMNHLTCQLLGRLAAQLVLGGGVGEALETLPSVGPMECVGETMHRLRRPLQAVNEARAKGDARARAAEALGHALLLRFGELAAEMGDDNMDEQHGAADGVSREEMLRRLLENLDDLHRFATEALAPPPAWGATAEEAAGVPPTARRRSSPEKRPARKLRDRIEGTLERWRSNLGGALGSQAGFRTRGDAKRRQRLRPMASDLGRTARVGELGRAQGADARAPADRGAQREGEREYEKVPRGREHAGGAAEGVRRRRTAPSSRRRATAR